MSWNSRRRDFLRHASLALAAASWPTMARAAQSQTSWASRAGFPSLDGRLCLDAANRHAMSAKTLEALQEYVQWRGRGAGGARK